ncbi:MAG: hypothetical protein WBM41_08400 [Arenicellales bacterium]|jgi:hypothetical protein
MIKNTKASAFLFCACFLLTGCWESDEVTFHEPGKYFGAPDNLKTDSAALQERFSHQQDR